MDKRYRKAIIAGNWKMNGDNTSLKTFFKEVKQSKTPKNITKNILCVPATLITAAQGLSKSSKFSVGTQNMHFEQSGAYTGELSASMIMEAGAEYVIIGHSERRKFFGETDEIVAKKTTAAVLSGLKPIICVGETNCQRNFGVTLEVIRRQLKIALSSIDAVQLKKIVIAYEPVWAIGTGRTATPEQAQEVCKEIRTCLREMYGAKSARAVSILYGGSLNANNAREIFEQYDIDGALVGGASLKAQDFLKIIEIGAEIIGK
ncbi:MAG: triose-phosphate isomerase [Clostridia bacterium]|nr:triose-phosphate isomerase [Clostridia bacterium]